jgi:hypothetical protein
MKSFNNYLVPKSCDATSGVMSHFSADVPVWTFGLSDRLPAWWMSPRCDSMLMALAGWWSDQRHEAVVYLIEENRILHAPVARTASPAHR